MPGSSDVGDMVVDDSMYAKPLDPVELVQQDFLDIFEP